MPTFFCCRQILLRRLYFIFHRSRTFINRKVKLRCIKHCIFTSERKSCERKERIQPFKNQVSKAFKTLTTKSKFRIYILDVPLNGTFFMRVCFQVFYEQLIIMLLNFPKFQVVNRSVEVCLQFIETNNWLGEM